MVKAPFASVSADYVGITGSVLCVIHCAATPLLLLTTTWFGNDIFQNSLLTLDYVFIAVNALAVFSATRHTVSLAIRAVLWSSLLLFASCLLLEDVSPLFEYGMYLASAGLTGGHLAHIRQDRNHSCAENAPAR